MEAADFSIKKIVLAVNGSAPAVEATKYAVGLTGTKRIALESVAEAVVEASEIPVLIVKGR